MGKHDVGEPRDEEESRAFTKALLEDVRALEHMLETGACFDPATRRIGAEQEMFLVDREGRPAPIATRIIETAGEPRLTTELALFNLEANASPLVFEGTCLSAMERELIELVGCARAAARTHGAEVVLTGILPTLRRADLDLANMTPSPRYLALNDAILSMRGGDFHIAIAGADAIDLTHDNVMFEACNTSFQVHFQVAPPSFARLYNAAQLATPAVLAAAASSPLLLGARLWHETRIALFSSSIDERNSAAPRELKPRVTFGDRWVERSVLEIFRDQIARYRVVLATPSEHAPMEHLARGEAPPLSALCVHNGTVYRWNRAVYGVIDGRAHLRIENRALPSGPTVLDEVANAAFFFGLLSGIASEIGDPSERIEFRRVEESFYAAARDGLDASLCWLDGDRAAVPLILEELLPLARRGLVRAHIDAGDVDRYLGVIEARVRAKRTGASWTLASFEAMGARVSAERRARSLVAAMVEREQTGSPVHEWALAGLADGGEHRRELEHAGRFMTTDLFTVREDDLVDLAASVREWRHVKNVPVEDAEGRLVGLVTHRDLLRLVTRGGAGEGVAVREIMTKDPPTIAPDTPVLEAMRALRDREVGCLPVVEHGKLVGLVTESDLLRVAAQVIARLVGS